jgi:hypothetical protein
MLKNGLAYVGNYVGTVPTGRVLYHYLFFLLLLTTVVRNCVNKIIKLSKVFRGDKRNP